MNKSFGFILKSQKGLVLFSYLLTVNANKVMRKNADKVDSLIGLDITLRNIRIYLSRRQV